MRVLLGALLAMGSFVTSCCRLNVAQVIETGTFTKPSGVNLPSTNRPVTNRVGWPTCLTDEFAIEATKGKMVTIPIELAPDAKIEKTKIPMEIEVTAKKLTDTQITVPIMIVGGTSAPVAIPFQPAIGGITNDKQTITIKLDPRLITLLNELRDRIPEIKKESPSGIGAAVLTTASLLALVLYTVFCGGVGGILKYYFGDNKSLRRQLNAEINKALKQSRVSLRLVPRKKKAAIIGKWIEDMTLGRCVIGGVIGGLVVPSLLYLVPGNIFAQRTNAGILYFVLGSGCVAVGYLGARVYEKLLGN